MTPLLQQAFNPAFSLLPEELELQAPWRLTGYPTTAPL
jgi:hypothetical protein